MLLRGSGAQHAFKCHRVALRQRGQQHRSCPAGALPVALPALHGEHGLQRSEPKGSAAPSWDTGMGDTGTVAAARAWHPFPAAAHPAEQTAAAKPPLLRTQSCKSQALILQTSRPEGAGPPWADPDPSHIHSGARGTHGLAKAASPQPWGARGRCCPALRRRMGDQPPAPPASPISSHWPWVCSRRPRPGPSPPAPRLRSRSQEWAEK